MTLVGYERSDFVTKDGVHIEGCNVYLGVPIKPDRGDGLRVERAYLTDRKAEMYDIDLPSLQGKEVEAMWTRQGKLQCLVPLA